MLAVPSLWAAVHHDRLNSRSSDVCFHTASSTRVQAADAACTLSLRAACSARREAGLMKMHAPAHAGGPGQVGIADFENDINTKVKHCAQTEYQPESCGHAREARQSDLFLVHPS
eukprot:3931787-Rhodomonas_salina.4